MNIASDYAQPFDVIQPKEQEAPFVLNSPHSGDQYPPRFLDQSQLDALAIRKSEDFEVHNLFAPCVELGMPLLHARFPRAYLDVNREPYELDPAMFDSQLPAYAKTNTTRVASGLGTIARIVSEGQNIYSKKLALAELDRIKNFYVPYHEMLRILIANTAIRFGYSILLDCHSMPSSSVKSLSPKGCDIVLGDRYCSSCSPEITAAAGKIFTALGYNVVVNKPFAGGFITEHYGRPSRNLHALQIEINRGIYMDERKLERNSRFVGLQADLRTFAAEMVSLSNAGYFVNSPQAAQ